MTRILLSRHKLLAKFWMNGINVTETIGILGAGQLTTHVVRGLCRAGPRLDIIVSPRNVEVSAALAADHSVIIAKDNQEVVDRARMIFACLPASVGKQLLSELTFRHDQSVCSAMAGINHDTVAEVVAPAAACLTMMPGASNALGLGPCLLFPNNPEWRKLLEPLGQVFAFEAKTQFDNAAVFGAFSGASYFLLKHIADWFEEQGIESGTARQLVAETMAGNATVLKQSSQDWDHIMKSVATPGGVTEQMVDSLKDAGGLDSWKDGLNAVLIRMSKP